VVCGQSSRLSGVALWAVMTMQTLWFQVGDKYMKNNSKVT